MKTSHDPRHKRRQRITQELFSLEFHAQPVSEETKTIMKQGALLDEKIQDAAPDFPVDKINKADLAILRLGVYELVIEQKEPQNVIIDEAVELAKEFGNDSSPAFINGVLGHIISYAKSS